MSSPTTAAASSTDPVNNPNYIMTVQEDPTTNTAVLQVKLNESFFSIMFQVMSYSGLAFTAYQTPTVAAAATGVSALLAYPLSYINPQIKSIWDGLNPIIQCLITVIVAAVAVYVPLPQLPAALGALQLGGTLGGWIWPSSSTSTSTTTSTPKPTPTTTTTTS